MKAAFNVLITGAAGYLGSIVVQEIAAYMQQNSLSGKLVGVDIRRPTYLPEAAIFFQEEIRSAQLAKLCADHKIDVVLHLVAIVNPGKKSNRQLEYEIEVEGTRNVLEACLTAKVKRIIVSSSGAAYGYYADNPAWIREETAIRGNQEFAYAYHKRLVEELLATYRDRHHQLEQVIFRIGTILGATTRNQITALFQKPIVLAVRGSDSPFVFVWDRDVAACMREAVFSPKTGIYNLAGDGALSIHEIARKLGKPVLALPAGLLRSGLFVLKKLGLSQYGPEQLDFLRYRPVLDNHKLKTEFGFIPQKSSRDVFSFFINSPAMKRR